MQKIIRYLLIGIGILVVVPVLAVVIFVAVFDANAYKQDLSNVVLEKTGRDLQFQGDVSLTIFPSLGMKLGGMSFANAPGFGDLPMMRIGEASVSVDVMSLIRFTPEIDKLILRDFEVNLMRNKVGVNNWDDLVQKQGVAPSTGSSSGSASGSSAQASAESKAPSPTSSKLELKGAFAGLEIENLKLLWLDEQAGERYQVTDLDISTGRIAPNESFPLTMHLDASSSGDVEVALDLKANVEYLIDQQRLTLNEMILALNEFEIDGMVQVSNFGNPALRFDLASELLDVDALLGTLPASKAESAVTGPAPAGSSSGDGSGGVKDEDIQIALPMQALRDLDIDGKLRIAKMKVQNLHMNDFNMHLTAQKGLVALKPVNLKMYDGEVTANLAIDVTGKLPKYGVGKTFTGIQVGDLYKDYMGESPISGKLDGKVNLTTRGEWLSNLKKNSNGTMNLAFVDGALNGFNIRQSIEDAKAKLKGDDPPPQKTRKTDFSSLTISGVINSGVFSSDDLDIQAPALRVGGKGSADINREVVDYLVNAKLVVTSKGQQGGSADDLAGLSIPVRIKGPFTEPKVDVQLDEMLKAKVDAEKAKIKAQAAKFKAEIEAQKKALQAELKKQQKALEEAKKRELEKKLEVEKARAAKKLEDKLKKLLE